MRAQSDILIGRAAVEIRNIGGHAARKRRSRPSGFPLSRE